jgi:hypothetical protein
MLPPNPALLLLPWLRESAGPTGMVRLMTGPSTLSKVFFTDAKRPRLTRLCR